VKKPSGRQLFVGAVVAAVLLTIAVGLAVIGSPSEERARRLDERRVEHLRTIASAVDLYWTRNHRLPNTIDELRAEPGLAVTTTDPASGASYEFVVLDEDRYELCARFDRESDAAAERRGLVTDFYTHGPGRQCFQRQARTRR
jgi:hypothetical protein